MSEPKYATKGSQRWLQIVVNERPEILNQQLRTALALPSDSRIDWVSPIRSTRFCEYRDQACFDKLGVVTRTRALSDFWPARGAVWDGLASADDGHVIFVEAKAHLAELISPRSKASGPSLRKIQASLRVVQRDLAPHVKVDWSGTFYQYANRLAHLHFLRLQNRVKAHLVFVYFLNAEDVSGPATREEWLGAIRLMEGYLGVHRHKLSRFVHKVFVDVEQLRASKTAVRAFDIGSLPPG